MDKSLSHFGEVVRYALSFLLVLAIFFSMTPSAHSSKEGVLPFSSFTVQSQGIGSSGVIVVEGQKDALGNFKKLVVKAFGKTIEVNEDLLRKIPLKHPNGIQLSYEQGYEALGGRTVYITFLFGFTSGIKETFTITVTEHGQQSFLGADAGNAGSKWGTVPEDGNPWGRILNYRPVISG